MAVSSTATLVDALRQYRLVEEAQLAELKALQSRFPDPKALAGELIQRGWLTPYQANQLLQGRGQELILGSYVLLERLGEGGMGQVFKAKNWKLGRIVALKLIRKERLDNPDAIRRFEREVRSAAALSHPNIVHAHDADQIGGTHLLVMEFVEGTDLAKLVKKNGPLPVPQACEFIRQAALGLQHAHERGMVHRDIKPANLLLTADGKTVKVLDMGLARLDQPTGDDDKSSTMTQEGMVMGTPDYIAPEQALESHTVDIRGDIYSLGCTFYFLLTGKVPFPGGTLLQKLNKHQNEEVPAVEVKRPDVPPGVAQVVRKMMAKKPEDRYQTPGDVAAALASGLSTGKGTFPTASVDDRTIADGARVVPAPSDNSLDSALDYMAQRGDTEAVHSPHRLVRKAEERRLLLYLVAGGSFVLVVLAAALFVALKEPARKKPPGNEEAPPVAVSTPAKAKVDEAWLQKVAAMPAEKQVEAVAAKLKEFNPGFDGKVTHKVEGGVVTVLQFITDKVTDISPVRALTGLQTLNCSGTHTNWQPKGLLADLSPLKDMKLTKLDCRYTKVSDLSPLKDMKLTSLECSLTKVSDLSPLKDMKLTTLNCQSTPVTDLSPLKDMKLTGLECSYTQVSDLSPLKDMKLTWLNCQSTPVTDLSPLKDMKLTFLSLSYTAVSDLSPLKGMPLTTLDCHDSKVSDLSPLKDMKLTQLNCDGTQASDLSPLKGMPLKELQCDFKPYRDAEMLRSIKTLETINGKPVKEFWKEVDEKQVAFEAWCKQVATLPAEKQVEAVAAKLKELNPGFDGPVKHKVEGGVVTELAFITDKVTDISPVRALIGLRSFYCGGSWEKGQLADLSPLRGLPLESFDCENTKVSDLSPLKDMKLWTLRCAATKVFDLSPLRGMPLESLHCGDTKVADLSPLKDLKKLASLMFYRTSVSDLSPLKDMKLTGLNCGGTPVSDLSPLKDMKLTELICSGTKVSDLSLLKGMPLIELNCDFRPERDAEIVRSIKTLEKINLKPAQEFWKEMDAKQAAFEAWLKQVAAMPAEKQVEAVAAKLKELNPGCDGKMNSNKIENGVVTVLSFWTDNVTDISPVCALTGLRMLTIGGINFWEKNGKLANLSPLKDMKLTQLNCQGTQVSDLSPLKGMPLMSLNLWGTPVSDLSPLKGMPLTNLDCGGTQVADLSPVRGMKLTDLRIQKTPVSDLSLLKGMVLTVLDCESTKVSDLSPLKGMKLTWLDCEKTPVSDLSPLKGMKLTYLICSGTKVSDLSVLQGMPLQELQCDFKPERDAEILRSIKTLKKINDKPAAEFWKEVDEKKLDKKP